MIKITIPAAPVIRLSVLRDPGVDKFYLRLYGELVSQYPVAYGYDTPAGGWGRLSPWDTGTLARRQFCGLS